MKTLKFLLVAAVCFTFKASSQENQKLASREEVLKAVEIFAKSPMSERGKAAAATIAKFAQESDDVMITLSPKVTPWLGSDKTPKYSETLLGAYLAGNVKSQLQGRTKVDDPYAGVQQVLKTYAQLKEADKTLDIPEIQKFADLEEKKELKKYLDEAVKKGEKAPTK